MGRAEAGDGASGTGSTFSAVESKIVYHLDI
jgi:hypothetical protein